MEKKDILELIKVLKEIRDELKTSNKIKEKSHIIERKNFKSNRIVAAKSSSQE
tara:strand:- start:6827 stop:6985 length:159 start_codon:yes stop_codon:yes gene_type:complete